MALLTYYSIYEPSTINNIFDVFLSSLIDTNRGFNFFVDWGKVNKNIGDMESEISLLSSLSNSKDIEQEFRALIEKYPKVIKVLPLLVAERNKNIKVIEAIDSPSSVRNFDFGSVNEDVDNVCEFCVKTGIFDLLRQTNSLKDYLTGVEVGMDTHARKNRSGVAMELAVLPLIQEIANKNPGLQFLFQRQFKDIERTWGLSVPEHLRERKFDYAIRKDEILINIEVNFYSGGGSKPQEIVDAYINRQYELHDGSWKFIWITDGCGWLTGKNQIYRAFREIDYLLNLEFCRQGILESIIKDF